MRFYKSKKTKLFKLVSLTGLLELLNYINGFNFQMAVGALVGMVILMGLVFALTETEYVVLGNQIEVNSRRGQDVLTISKVKALEEYAIAFGSGGIIKKSAYFINYDGTLMRIKEGTYNDDGQDLAQYLNKHYDIAIIDKTKWK